MKYLLDTHLLLWIAEDSPHLSKKAKILINNLDNELLFSAANLWEISIKNAIGRADFQIDARLLRRNFLDNGYCELPITSKHVVAIDTLPLIHKDPFDRLLITQCMVEGITLLTTDSVVAQYPGPIQLI